MADTGEGAGLAPRRWCLGNRISSSLLGCELDDPALFWARCLEVMEIQQESMQQHLNLRVVHQHQMDYKTELILLQGQVLEVNTLLVELK